MDIDIPNDIPGHAIETMDLANSKALPGYAATEPVFFYPECGRDWNPVARFSDVCRVFIFCSKSNYKPFALEDCPDSLRNLFGQESAGSLVRNILRQETNLQSFQQGHWSRVERKIEVASCHLERKLFLAFLQADPVEVFQRLFLERGIGPKFVCLHPAQWEGSLSVTLRDADAARPKYVVGKWPEIHAPWTMLWQKYRSWDDTAVFQQRNALAHELQDAVDYENLNWVSTPMNPENVEGAHVLHLTVRDYLAHDWPDHIQCIFIDADREELPAEFWADDPRLSPLKLAGLPISTALPKLANACSELPGPNIQAIHTSRFGFEDETAALREVWPRCRWSLTIHCETQGDMDSLRGFVCGDLP